MQIAALGAIEPITGNHGSAGESDGGAFAAILGATAKGGSGTGPGKDGVSPLPLVQDNYGTGDPTVQGVVSAASPVLAPGVPAAGTKASLLGSTAALEASPAGMISAEIGLPAVDGNATPLPPVPAPAESPAPEIKFDEGPVEAPVEWPSMPGSPVGVQPKSGDAPASLPEVPGIGPEEMAPTAPSAELLAEVESRTAEDQQASSPSEQAMAQRPVPSLPPPQMARLTIDGQPEYTAAIKKPEMHGVGTQASGSQSGETSAKPASDPFLSTAATVAPDQLQAQSQSLTTALPGGANANAMLPKAEPAPPFAAQVQPPVQPQPVVAFRADKAARDMGLEIARRVGAGGEELVIRLDPAELGRINIRMAVNEHGQLRAIVAADAPAVLDALRSDISELNRALEQAGIRTDSQSFRFDRGAGDSGSQWQQRYQQQANNRGDGSPSATGSEDEPAYRPMATNGRINMMA